MNGQRTDELGILGKSLNKLSQNLRAALTDLKKANAELEADIEREKKLEQAQLDFFSAASHELKTPITIIKGQLEGMLLGIGAYKDREKYLSRSLGVTQILESMVYELLTISRLQIHPEAVRQEEAVWDFILCRKYYSSIIAIVVSVTRRMALSSSLNSHKLYKHTIFPPVYAAGLRKACRIFVTTHKSQINPKCTTKKAVII